MVVGSPYGRGAGKFGGIALGLRDGAIGRALGAIVVVLPHFFLDAVTEVQRVSQQVLENDGEHDP